MNATLNPVNSPNLPNVFSAGLGGIAENFDPSQIVAYLSNFRSTLTTLTDIFQALNGTIKTAGQIGHKLKYDPSTQSPPYVQSALLGQSIPIGPTTAQKTTINGKIYTLSKLRSVLSSILTIIAVGLLTAGGFMAYANRDSIQDVVQGRIRPMVNQLNIKEVIEYLSVISKRLMNYIKHSSSPIIAKLKSKFLQQVTRRSVKKTKTTKTTSRRPKSSRKMSPRSKSVQNQESQTKKIV